MSTTSPRLPAAQDLGHGITCIDTEQQRPGLACCYLLQHGGEAALIECGTSHGVPGLLARLEQMGIAREQVRYLIPTHVHLDHAGGAGRLMRELPNAQLVAHPRGARHLIDPSKLIAGATAVYGEAAMQAIYGEILSADESRMIVADDGYRLNLAGRELVFIDSPGHARHHFSVWDAVSQGFFTGDTFGLSYRAFDGPAGPWLMPTTTPVQFEPEAWERTLDRYLSYAPQRMYLTHYGAVDEVPRLAHELRAGLIDYQHLAMSVEARGADRQPAIKQALYDWSFAELRRRRVDIPEALAREWLEFDLDLNAQGLVVWLDKQQSAQ
ncbi:MAG: fold metallo-hydrolase [Hydrocarboniphaga sp.]|uniref:MBL fold metallo-hydrolase n=1 Tax=Hydrocarboniphaga sp. TaxID=2033016 RepID=UPI00261DA11C|nr:MBL fold metallo-hydrolase [Hydrocarboniphaga sp.]MDB5972379.1 fold metallo-hydrolase [Hydrocarboniphaga sp.]